MTEKNELPHQKSYTENEGVRFFGEIKEWLSKLEAKQIEATPASVLHIIRHLKSLSPEAKNKLLALDVDEDFINAQLESIGSKFHKKINDPYQLLEVCQEVIQEKVNNGAEIPWIYSKEAGEFEAKIKIEFSTEQKQALGLDPDEYTGDISVVRITPEIENQVTKEQRGQGEEKDHIEINVISGIKPPETDTLIISLKKKGSEDLPQFYTVYTGILSPSLPRAEEQSEEEFKYNKSWWSSYAFIKQ